MEWKTEKLNKHEIYKPEFQSAEDMKFKGTKVD